MSEADDVLRSIDQLRRDLSGYHGQMVAHNNLQRHCDNQRKRIAELEGLYSKAKDENTELRELARISIEHCDSGTCDECPIQGEDGSCPYKEMALKLGVEVVE